jgi:predicted 3-demethylubiquinone-9 3-methyltransferase (glyoxalase superfamily)
MFQHGFVKTENGSALSMQKISTCLWFDTEAEDAAKFYTSIFPGSELGKTTFYPNTGQEIHGKTAGSVMTVEFSLSGCKYMALNGGPYFKFNEATSQVVNCEDQKEIDYFWEKLGAGGDPKAQQCGWLKDKFGLSWQIVPMVMDKIFATADKAAAERAMSAMLKMKKLNITELEKAAKVKS